MYILINISSSITSIDQLRSRNRTSRRAQYLLFNIRNKIIRREV